MELKKIIQMILADFEKGVKESLSQIEKKGYAGVIL